MAAEPWKSRRPWPLLVPLGVYALLLAWIGFSAAAVQGYDFSYLLYALANLIVFTDAIDFGLRLYVHRRHTAVTADLSRGAVRQLSIDLPAAQRKLGRPITARATCRPYAIIASIYNLEDELDEFMERLEPHRDHVWLISDGSTDRTARRLQQWGWRCLDEEENRHKPAALRHLLQTLPPQIETVMVIDPDGRLVVSTHGPHTLRRWYSQRVGWYYGFLRLYTQRTRELWRIGRRAPFAMYNFIGYMGVLGLGLHVLRIASAVLLLVSAAAILDSLFALHLLQTGRAINPVCFAGAIGSYLVLAVIALFTVVPGRERAFVGPILPIYFLYVLAHIVPITVGFGNWVALRLWGRRIYRDHYQVREDDPTVPLPRLKLRPNGSGTATL